MLFLCYLLTPHSAGSNLGGNHLAISLPPGFVSCLLESLFFLCECARVCTWQRWAEIQGLRGPWAEGCGPQAKRPALSKVPSFRPPAEPACGPRAADGQALSLLSAEGKEPLEKEVNSLFALLLACHTPSSALV